MATTIASGVGMTNAWLAEQGVLSLKSLWADLAHLLYTARCGRMAWWCRENPRKRATLPDLSSDFRAGINGLFAEIVSVMANEPNRFSWIKQ